MDSILEDLQCLQGRIEVARKHLHKMVMQWHLAMLEEEVVQLSQLLDDYIVCYLRGQKFMREEDRS